MTFSRGCQLYSPKATPSLLADSSIAWDLTLVIRPFDDRGHLARTEVMRYKKPVPGSLSLNYIKEVWGSFSTATFCSSGRSFQLLCKSRQRKNELKNGENWMPDLCSWQLCRRGGACDWLASITSTRGVIAPCQPGSTVRLPTSLPLGQMFFLTQLFFCIEVI